MIHSYREFKEIKIKCALQQLWCKLCKTFLIKLQEAQKDGYSPR